MLIMRNALGIEHPDEPVAKSNALEIIGQLSAGSTRSLAFRYQGRWKETRT